jgi:hypothetical protein
MALGKSNFDTQYENKIYSSMMLLVDHMLLRNGGYSPQTLNMYEDAGASNWKNLYTYTTSYKQFAADESLGLSAPQFTVPAGGSIASRKLWDGALLLSSKPTGTGSNGLVLAPTVSGYMKDVNIYSSSKSDTDIIFDSYSLTSHLETSKGLPYKSSPYPGIWLKINDAQDKPFAFGGGSPLMRSNMTIRAVCLSDSPYSLDAMISIFRKLGQKALPVVSENYNLINDYYGGWDGNGSWNFTGNAHEKDGPWIDKVNVSRIGRKGPIKLANPNAISALVDFDLVYYKQGDTSNPYTSYDTVEWGSGPYSFEASRTGT